MIKNITFDLDGTLIDSYKTIFKAAERTLLYLGIKEQLIEKEFYKRIGHHFMDIFQELNIPVLNFEEFIQIYKKIYFDYIDDSKKYPGLLKTLDFIRNKKIYISLLTTKGQDQADKIIDYFNLRNYFSIVMGRRDKIANKPSAEPLLFICNELKVMPNETLMVGDTELDIQCGKNAGAKTCGCSYGYRTSDLLSLEAPDFIIASISDLPHLLNI